MFFSPDYIVYVWMIPLFVFLFVPLAIALGGSVLYLSRHYIFSGEALCDESRKHPRFVPQEEVTAEVSLGETIYTGLICDISKVGICLKNLPDILYNTMEQLTVTIRSYGEVYQLQVSPKWVLATVSGQQIGAEIDTSSQGWGQFIGRIEETGQP